METLENLEIGQETVNIFGGENYQSEMKRLRGSFECNLVAARMALGIIGNGN